MNEKARYPASDMHLQVRQVTSQVEHINSYELVHPEGLDLPPFSAGAVYTVPNDQSIVDELVEGRMVRLFQVDCPSTVACYLVCPEAHQDLPKISALCAWILEEAAEMHGPLEQPASF